MPETRAGDYQESVQSRMLRQTLDPVWGDPQDDKFVFELDHTYKTIQIKMFDWDEIGAHDYMGQVPAPVHVCHMHVQLARMCRPAGCAAADAHRGR